MQALASMARASPAWRPRMQAGAQARPPWLCQAGPWRRVASLAARAPAETRGYRLESLERWPPDHNPPLRAARLLVNRGASSTAQKPTTAGGSGANPIPAPAPRPGHLPAPSAPLTVPLLPTLVSGGAEIPMENGDPELRFVAPPPLTWARLSKTYGSLTKTRLSGLVVLTTLAGFGLSPALGSLPLTTVLHLLASTTVGTGLCVFAANALNQWLEAPFDAQMPRTRGRPLVQHRISPHHAFAFGAVSGTAGVGLLWAAVNPLVSMIGAANIALYAFVYTPLKRVHIANTWVGALVGVLPPLMGWAAVSGTLGAPSDAGAWLLALVLLSWQFPHFHALSWTLGSEYARAGYKMASVLAPDLCTASALRHALLLFPWTLGLSWVGTTAPAFILVSWGLNALLLRGAWRFWRAPSEATAKHLFWATLIYLPAVLVAAVLTKRDVEPPVEPSEPEQGRGASAVTLPPGIPAIKAFEPSESLAQDVTDAEALLRHAQKQGRLDSSRASEYWCMYEQLERAMLAVTAAWDRCLDWLRPASPPPSSPSVPPSKPPV